MSWEQKIYDQNWEAIWSSKLWEKNVREKENEI